MSSSIAIPKSSTRSPNTPRTPVSISFAGSSPSSSSSSSYGAPTNPSAAMDMAAPSPSEVVTIKDKGKGKLVKNAERTEEEERERWASSPFKRRQSLMGKELEKAKHIVVDIGPPDAPRLISCLASSQGFEWNSSIFLPRYLTGRAADESLEHRQDPIQDIIITDEECKELLPQW